MSPETANLAEIEFFRGLHAISRNALCREAGIDAGTYRRWQKYVRGQDGGSAPNIRSLVRVRAALVHLIKVAS